MSQLSIPALNKWTTVSPSATVVAAMQHFCGIFPKVFRECFPVKPSGRCSSSEDEQDEAAQLGQPIGPDEAMASFGQEEAAQSRRVSFG